MGFPDAVRETEALRDAYRAGLQAVRSADRRHIVVAPSRSVSGSVDLDNALRSDFPNEPRWDYGIGFRSPSQAGEVVYWVEVHPANSGSVKAVLAKLDWLKRWLRRDAPKLQAITPRFIWVSSGRTGFTQQSRQRRLLASRGIAYRGRVLRIPDKSGS